MAWNMIAVGAVQLLTLKMLHLAAILAAAQVLRAAETTAGGKSCHAEQHGRGELLSTAKRAL